jgi:hypothetical protein
MQQEEKGLDVSNHLNEMVAKLNELTRQYQDQQKTDDLDRERNACLLEIFATFLNRLGYHTYATEMDVLALKQLDEGDHTRARGTALASRQATLALAVEVLMMLGDSNDKALGEVLHEAGEELGFVVVDPRSKDDPATAIDNWRKDLRDRTFKNERAKEIFGVGCSLAQSYIGRGRGDELLVLGNPRTRMMDVFGLAARAKAGTCELGKRAQKQWAR